MHPPLHLGSITIEGHRGPSEIKAVGYLEMTGYDRPVQEVADDPLESP